MFFMTFMVKGRRWGDGANVGKMLRRSSRRMKGMKSPWENQDPTLHVLHDLHGEELLLEER
jgi:hypothetical protein